MRYIRQLCCVSLLCLSGSAVAANVRLQVEGLSGQLEKNVRAQLSTIESDEVTPDRRFRARVDDAIREGLKALGSASRPLNLISVHRQRKGGRY
ncbi:POTRA domain-containing protein [Escherichia coli]